MGVENIMHLDVVLMLVEELKSDFLWLSFFLLGGGNWSRAQHYVVEVKTC